MEARRQHKIGRHIYSQAYWRASSLSVEVHQFPSLVEVVVQSYDASPTLYLPLEILKSLGERLARLFNLVVRSLKIESLIQGYNNHFTAAYKAGGFQST